MGIYVYMIVLHVTYKIDSDIFENILWMQMNASIYIHIEGSVYIRNGEVSHLSLHLSTRVDF